jgi:hypothetical protein
LLAVLYVAFLAKYLTKGALGGYLSSLPGAAAAVLAASYFHRHLGAVTGLGTDRSLAKRFGRW